MEEYLWDVLKDWCANIIGLAMTAIGIWGITLLRYYIKRNNGIFSKTVAPSKRVFITSRKQWDDIKVCLETSKFENTYSDEEQEQLLSHSTGKKLFNGDMVRLVKMKDDKCYVQEIKYFDFLTTNLVIKPASSKLLSPRDVLWHTVFDEEFRTRSKLENRLKAKVAWYGKLRGFDDVLNVKELANAIAISVVIRDCNDKILLVRRGNKNAISSGTFASTVTGSIVCSDLKADNPFLFAAQREVKEELNLEIKNLRVSEIIIVKQKYQPVVLIEGFINERFEDIVEQMKMAEDYSDENTSIYAVPEMKIRNVVRKYRFTDASVYQLVGNCGFWKWLFTMKRDINKYSI